MKTKMIKSLSVCGLALSLVAAGQSVMTAHNLAHAELPPVAAVGDGTTATGKVLIKGNSSKNSFVEQVSQDGSKTTVQYFIGNKQLPGFDENAKILAQDENTVVLSEPSSHALAVVAKDHNGQALTAYTGVDLDYLTNKIKQEAAKNKNIIYDRIDTRDCTVGGKHFSIPYLQTEITKIDGGVTVMGNGIGCHIFETNGRLQEMDNVGAYAHKYVPSKVSIAANNDVTVDYENSPYTYKNNILNPNNPSANTVAKSTANSHSTSSSSAKANSSVSDKAVTTSVNSDKANNADTKTDKDSISSTTAANGDKSSAKIDKLDDASSKAESGVAGQKSSVADGQASGESSSIKSGSISGKSDGASAKSASLSVSSSSVKSSGTESGSGESGSADKIAGQSSSIASSQESSQLSSASSSENGAANGTGSGTAVGGQAGSNGFEANGNNQGSGNEAGTPASTQPGGDDTYSPQKAAMLAKTNAKVAESGIVAAIGAAIGTVAGWFGLKKKN